MKTDEKLKVKSKKSLSCLITLLGLFVLISSGAPASAELTAIANHDHISVDFFYHGSNVSVRGISDPDADLIIKISSPDGHHSLRQKGKIGGLLWMNVGTLDFERVPSLYFLSSWTAKLWQRMFWASRRSKNILVSPR
jgi:hypothetical protein